MVRWLALIFALGLLSRFTGGHIDSAAHLGGAFAGALFAALWRRDRVHSERATRAILGGCGAVLVACVAVVGWRDQTDPYAVLTLQERDDATRLALEEGRCRDAHEGLRAVERLRSRMAPVSQLREHVEGICGHVSAAR